MDFLIILLFSLVCVSCSSHDSSDLAEDLKSLLQRFEVLESSHRHLQTEVKDLRIKVTLLMGENGNLRRKMENEEQADKKFSIGNENHTKHLEMSNYPSTENRLRIRRSSSNLGFSASMNRNIGVSSSQILVFERETTNIDQRYSLRSGHFLAPYDGLYFFTVTIVAMPNKYIETQIMHNGHPICNIISGVGGSYYGSGTSSVVVSLSSGDDVYVQVRGGQHSSGTVIDGSYSRFTGFFLSPNV